MFSLLALLILAMASTAGAQKMSFGRGVLSEFAFADGYVNLNHGSFGAAPKSVLQTQKAYAQQVERMPDIWFRAGAGYRELVQERVDQMGKYLNVTEAGDLVLVENASSGVNAVLRSVMLSRGDKVLITSTAYPMVKNVLKYLVHRHGIEVIEVPLVFPMTSDDDIVVPISKAIAEHGSSIKLASFSHIDSVPGFILPVDRLIRLCRASGIKVLIDGAHAIGQIPINLGSMDPDYYVTNTHKWFYGPKGTALFYVRKDKQAEIFPTVVSSEFSLDTFSTNFLYTGTRDYTGFASLQSALEFRQQFGEQEIMAYMHDLAWWAGSHLAALWNTSLLVPEHMVGSMIDVELPFDTFERADQVRQMVFEKYNTYFIVHSLQGRPYTRLSAQIYLEQADFELFGKRILEYI